MPKRYVAVLKQILTGSSGYQHSKCHLHYDEYNHFNLHDELSGSEQLQHLLYRLILQRDESARKLL